MKPGQEIIDQGLADLAEGRETIQALLVAIGAPRLRRSGIAVPDHKITSPEHRLYKLLAKENPDGAHSKYNALIRRLVSYERALECGI
jgi:hypothetical protein